MKDRRIKLIIGGSQTGKTSQLIDEVVKDPQHNVLVCFSERERERLLRRYPGLRGSIQVAAHGCAPISDKHWVGLDNFLCFDKPMEVLNAWWAHSDELVVTTDIPFVVEYLA